MSSFPTSTRFQSACSLLNKIPVAKLSLVIKRVLLKISVKSATFFTDEELDKLSAQFSLTVPELNDCLSALHYSFSQCAYSSVSPENLAATLSAASLSTEHAEVMSASWGKEAAGVVKRIRDASALGAPKVLTSTDWSLSIAMSSSDLKNTKQASARFELNLDRPNGGGDPECVTMELQHEELYDLFKKLEDVQESLDALS
ncbi:hypothetical protein TeGR_g10320 [Tetraparma gracilis]|uniref:COMM domain-containing protein n=1 Tax=Tetraparma gracilis TaxID=2962635 RepID=A0ABQ6N192_9STRA|nr:hypothetical protein TeGR_g10320 [Tetraparma gracilis]